MWLQRVKETATEFKKFKEALLEPEVLQGLGKEPHHRAAKAKLSGCSLELCLGVERSCRCKRQDLRSHRAEAWDQVQANSGIDVQMKDYSMLYQ